MKAKDVVTSVARGEQVFAVADYVKRFGLLTTVKVARVEAGMCVLLNLAGQDVAARRRPAELISLAEANAIIKQRLRRGPVRIRTVGEDDGR